MSSPQLQASQPSRFLRFPRKLLLLLLSTLGVQGLIGVYGDKEKEDSPKDASVRDQTAAITSTRLLVDLPDVTFDREDDGDQSDWLLEPGNGDEPMPAGDGRSHNEGLKNPAQEITGGGGELLSPEESAEALLADGEPRCFTVDGATSEEEGGARRGLCLPTLFFLGVSKCGEWF